MAERLNGESPDNVNYATALAALCLNRGNLDKDGGRPRDALVGGGGPIPAAGHRPSAAVKDSFAFAGCRGWGLADECGRIRTTRTSPAPRFISFHTHRAAFHVKRDEMKRIRQSLPIFPRFARRNAPDCAKLAPKSSKITVWTLCFGRFRSKIASRIAMVAAVEGVVDPVIGNQADRASHHRRRPDT
jgi:hypothetical protein